MKFIIFVFAVMLLSNNGWASSLGTEYSWDKDYIWSSFSARMKFSSNFDFSTGVSHTTGDGYDSDSLSLTYHFSPAIFASKPKISIYSTNDSLKNKSYSLGVGWEYSFIPDESTLDLSVKIGTSKDATDKTESIYYFSTTWEYEINDVWGFDLFASFSNEAYLSTAEQRSKGASSAKSSGKNQSSSLTKLNYDSISATIYYEINDIQGVSYEIGIEKNASGYSDSTYSELEYKRDIYESWEISFDIGEEDSPVTGYSNEFAVGLNYTF